ncbi:MAG TPA: hypothetical protein V6C86_06405 [Oculatellaceae cyanobacterium]
MKSDEELNNLAATAILHWTVENGFYINSVKHKVCAVLDYRPISDPEQYKYLAGKMQARDYQIVVREIEGRFEVEYSKYGEFFKFIDITESRAGTIAALMAYQQLGPDTLRDNV